MMRALWFIIQQLDDHPWRTVFIMYLMAAFITAVVATFMEGV